MLRPLAILLCSLICLASLGAQGTCGRAPFYGYRFLDPRLLDYDSQLYPFYDIFAEARDTEPASAAELRKEANLNEWHERFCEQALRADIESLLYGQTLRGLRNVLDLQGNKKARGADLGTLRANSFAVHLVEYQCREVAEYLVYAKNVEPLVTRQTGFNAAARREEDMKKYIDVALDRFNDLESHYVRLRYAYQVIRLAHYLGENAYVLELYDYLMPKIEADPSVLYDWIEGHRAGALQALGNNAEAGYLYSRLFDRCVSCREFAVRSFRIRTDAQWDAAVLRTQNVRERAMLHVLRAQNERALVVEEMEKIYALDPGNRSLEPLLMRELLELEKDLLGLDFNPRAASNRTIDIPRPQAAKRLVRVQELINKVVSDGRAARPELWLLARATVEMLAGDYFYARRSFDKLRGQYLDDSLRQQARIYDEVLNVLALDRVTDSVEMYYFDLLQDDALRSRYPDFRTLVNDKLEKVYAERGQPGKAALMRYGFDALLKNPRIGYVSELEGMADSLTGNSFDRLMLSNRVGPNAADDIEHLRGLFYLQRGQWETALEAFTEIPRERLDQYGRFAPFVRQFHDRVDFKPSAAERTYNKQELLSRLLELEDEARRTENDTLAARNYFNIGLAHYNMSYYGYLWEFADAFRSGTSAVRAARSPRPDNVFSHPRAPLGNKENFSMDRARYYFERALSRSPTREAAAQTIYHLAKTERNENYAAGRTGRARSFTFLSRLRDEYDDTEYYGYVVAECKTFAWFVGQ